MISEVDKFRYTNTVYRNIPIALDFSRPRNPKISDASDSNSPSGVIYGRDHGQLQHEVSC